MGWKREIESRQMYSIAFVLTNSRLCTLCFTKSIVVLDWRNYRISAKNRMKIENKAPTASTIIIIAIYNTCVCIIGWKVSLLVVGWLVGWTVGRLVVRFDWRLTRVFILYTSAGMCVCVLCVYILIQKRISIYLFDLQNTLHSSQI